MAKKVVSPVRADGFKNLQLDAGIFLKNFTYDNIADSSALLTAVESAVTAGTNLLGMTSGGGNFTVNREMRTADVDGIRYPFKGQDMVDSVDCFLSTTLKEVTPQHIKDCLGSAGMTTSGKKTTIKMRTSIEDGDFLTNLCWIGTLADGQLVLICLFNAFNKADFTLTFTDKGEGSIPVEYHAYQDDVNDFENAPFEVVFFDNPTV